MNFGEQGANKASKKIVEKKENLKQKLFLQVC